MSESNFDAESILGSGLRPFQYWQVKTSQMLSAWQRQDPSAGYKTGLNALDEFIRLVPGEVTVFGARPGMGKSAIIMQIAMNILPMDDPKRRIAIFSAEMTGWSLYMRIACGMAGVSMFDLRSGRASQEQYGKVDEAILSLRELPILIDDSTRPSSVFMRQELGIMNESYKISCLIFDFLELIGDKSGSHENDKLSAAMQNLKDIAKEFDMPVLVISQLSREVESRADKIPQLDDLRYSGMIEQLADQVILMSRPQYYLDKGVKIDLKPYEKFQDGGADSNLDVAYLFVAKNRNGRTGVARLAYDGPRMRFYDITRTNLNEGLE